MAQKRAEEAEKQRQEHKARMAAMKKKKKGPAKKRVGGFDRSKLNPMFMANAREKKDDTQGWSFDFNN